MRIFVYCSEGIGFVCDADEEIPKGFPYSYVVDETEESYEDRFALLK